MVIVASVWEQLCPLTSQSSVLCVPAPIVNTAQAWKGGAGLLQRQVETVLLWVPPAPPGVSFLFYAYTCRLTLEKVPETVRKDSLTTGKVLLTVGKTAAWDLLTRARKTILRKLGCVWSGAVFICLRMGVVLSVGCAPQLEGCVFCRWALQS